MDLGTENSEVSDEMQHFVVKISLAMFFNL